MNPGRAAAAFVTAVLLARHGLAAQAVADSTAAARAPDAIIVELAMGRYVSRTVPAFRSGDDALLPLTQLADLAEDCDAPASRRWIGADAPARGAPRRDRAG